MIKKNIHYNLTFFVLKICHVSYVARDGFGTHFPLSKYIKRSSFNVGMIDAISVLSGRDVLLAHIKTKHCLYIYLCGLLALHYSIISLSGLKNLP